MAPTIEKKIKNQMSTNSKNKGNRFERTIAKFFEDWTGYKFSRTPGSGGWAKAKDSFGDLVCTDEKHSRRFPFSIECKSYQELKFEHILLGVKSCRILSFWDQALNDANKAGKIPMLIMKYNNMPKGEAFLMVDIELSKLIDKQPLKKPTMAISTENHYFKVYMLSDIKNIDYKTLYKEARKLLKK